VDSQLLTGVVLIIAGIALSLLAYAIVLNRKERAASDSQAAEAGDTPEPPVSPVPATPPAGAPPAASGASVPTLSGAVPRGLVLVTELLRDERTGALIVRLGEKEYRSARELRTSGEWTRVEKTAADLRSWLAEAGTAERPREPSRTEGLPRPHTMIDQINEILTRKLDAAGAGERAVRLIDAGGGAVHVYVGLQRYEMDTVPDEDVRRLIREAVAEWEARQ
jgi:hypothetical protein